MPRKSYDLCVPAGLEGAVAAPEGREQALTSKGQEGTVWSDGNILH